jgi:hypothetical protein
MQDRTHRGLCVHAQSSAPDTPPALVCAPKGPGHVPR